MQTSITIDASDLEPGIIIVTVEQGSLTIPIRLDAAQAEAFGVMYANACMQMFAETALVAITGELQSRDTAARPEE